MLKGQKINLRTMRSRDLETYLDLFSDIESRGLHFPLRMPTETSVAARFAKDGFWSDESGTMLIVEKENDRIVGMVVYFKPMFYHDSFELGYIIFDPADRGKGYVPEAMRLFTKYMFDSKPVFRLQLQIEPGNMPSRRVAEKCGFKFEGTARQAFVSRGKPVDIDVYSLLREEFESLA